jgi:prevent-host-death family protein
LALECGPIGQKVFGAMHDPNHKGNVAELAIATEAARLGLSVLKPLTEHERYDLAIGIGGQLLRVQCKWASHNGDVVQIHTARCRTNRRGNIRSTYRTDEIDALGAYCSDLDRCYLLPVKMVAGRHMLHLRTAAPRNNQRAAINYAADYELGAVAQGKSDALAARRSRVRIPPAPLSDDALMSFPQDEDFVDLKQSVGMDEFYAKLAQYVRHAEAGSETLVTRWGRPVARLGPAALKDAPAPADE